MADAISVFDKVWNEALKNYFKNINKCFKTVKIDKWPDLPYSPPPPPPFPQTAVLE